MAAADSNTNPNLQQVFKGFSSRAENTNFRLYDFQLIRQDLINQLSIRQGERVENPAYGTIIYDCIHEPLTDALKDQILADVTRIFNSDPRLAASNIVVSEQDSGISIQADLTYIPYNITEKLRFNFDQNSTLSLS
jgi:phage baseplate assembly protein W